VEVANTSVHFPEGMLDDLDRLSEEQGVSRNRLIVDACRHALGARRRWPDAFFSNAHRTAGELRELQKHAEEFARTLAGGRRSRRQPPF
jgi:metal-responsive CopG/Arc/MetJ family transcriptional regulator